MTIIIGVSLAPVARPASDSTQWRAARSIMAPRLLDCLNLNAEAVPTGWERFASDMALANKAQYNEWSAKLKPLRVSGAGESDLCRYVAQCAQMGKKIEDEDLRRLYVANESVQQTRDLLRPAPTEEYTAKFNHYEMDKDHVWAPTPVISKAFVAEVNARQESGIEKLAKMGWAVGATSPAIIAKARGNQEILLAGARRAARS